MIALATLASLFAFAFPAHGARCEPDVWTVHVDSRIPGASYTRVTIRWPRGCLVAE